MSVAFTKEDSAETAAETLLPDRPISGAANLVTEKGLAALKAHLLQARADYAAALGLDDVNERRRQSAVPLRDLRYYAARVHSAQLVTAPSAVETVSFGCTVTFRRGDSRVQSYRIVGEDEADPKAGSISHVSPIAVELAGKRVGELANVAGQELEIISVC